MEYYQGSKQNKNQSFTRYRFTKTLLKQGIYNAYFIARLASFDHSIAIFLVYRFSLFNYAYITWFRKVINLRSLKSSTRAEVILNTQPWFNFP
jgi:hypothetical protein